MIVYDLIPKGVYVAYFAHTGDKLSGYWYSLSALRRSMKAKGYSSVKKADTLFKTRLHNQWAAQMRAAGVR